MWISILLLLWHFPHLRSTGSWYPKGISAALAVQELCILPGLSRHRPIAQKCLAQARPSGVLGSDSCQCAPGDSSMDSQHLPSCGKNIIFQTF